LRELKLAPSTYYRWKWRYAKRGIAGLDDLPSAARRVWNRLGDEERDYVVEYALEHPSLSPREVATRLIDRKGRFVSESTVYRILKEAGLVTPHGEEKVPCGQGVSYQEQRAQRAMAYRRQLLLRSELGILLPDQYPG